MAQEGTAVRGWLLGDSGTGTRRIRCQISLCMTHVPETGARKWSRFMVPVSGACVMGVSQLIELSSAVVK